MVVSAQWKYPSSVRYPFLTPSYDTVSLQLLGSSSLSSHTGLFALTTWSRELRDFGPASLDIRWPSYKHWASSWRLRLCPNDTTRPNRDRQRSAMKAQYIALQRVDGSTQAYSRYPQRPRETEISYSWWCAPTPIVLLSTRLANLVRHFNL